MDKACIARMVCLNLVKSIFKEYDKRYIPVAGSNRHIHLCKQDIEKLFGQNYSLNEHRPLSQPNQYAAKEQVTIKGPKGSISDVRVLGPARKETQVEIFYADSFKIGVKPVMRVSGDIEGTPGIKIIGPAGEATLKNGVIVAARHLHISPEQSEWMGIENGDIISVKKEGKRALIIENIPVRCGEGHSLELHLDLEEANAGFIKNGDLLELVSIKQR